MAATTGRGRPADAPSQPNARRWCILETEAAVVVIDWHKVEADRAQGQESSGQVPLLTIQRGSGRAEESCVTAAEAIQLCRGGSLESIRALAAPDDAFKLPRAPRRFRAHAVAGILAMQDASILMVVTEAEVTCEVDGKPIWEVTAVERVPLRAPPREGERAAAITQLFDGVTKLLCGRGFYFAPEFDITHTLQWKKRRVLQARRNGEDPVPRLPDGSPDLMAAAEPRFVWNEAMVACLLQQEGVSARWFAPLMQGYIQAAHHKEPHPEDSGWELQLSLLLISRRSKGRAGTRYNARGLDQSGEVGNLIESEQLLRLRPARAVAGAGPCPAGVPHGWLSLVQLRGSVPVFWEQSPEPGGRPGPVLLTRDPALATPAFERHHGAMEEAYEGTVYYANLLSSAPMEQLLTQALEHQLLGPQRDASRAAYCHFDFHSRVKGSSQAAFDAELEALLEQLRDFLETSGHLDATAESPAGIAPEPRRWQAGVLRTNCLDCLDRTNVVQFYVAWNWLRRYCWRHGALHGLVTPQGAAPLPETAAPGNELAAQDESQKGAAALLLDNAPSLHSLQKAGTSLIGGIGSMVGKAASGAVGAGDELLDASADVKRREVLRELLQELWAEHGDRVSQLYTGAGSIMSSVLRHGRQSTYSKLEKGLQGINRAYQASFQDAQRQECIDFVLGLHRDNASLPCNTTS